MRPAWRYFSATLLLLALTLLALPQPATAHRVNVFAFVDGADIQVESSFNRGSPVNGGQVQVIDAANGAILLAGMTNAEGVFRFPVPETARTQGHDLLIRINAGEGHQSEWRIPASDLVEGNAVDAVSTIGGLQTATTPPPAPQAGQSITLGPQELEKIIDAALERKLSPIRRMLSEQYTAGPSLRDIIGGIGWLIGLAGLAAYFKSRRGNDGGSNRGSGNQKG